MPLRLIWSHASSAMRAKDAAQCFAFSIASTLFDATKSRGTIDRGAIVLQQINVVFHTIVHVTSTPGPLWRQKSQRAIAKSLSIDRGDFDLDARKLDLRSQGQAQPNADGHRSPRLISQPSARSTSAQIACPATIWICCTIAVSCEATARKCRHSARMPVSAAPKSQRSRGRDHARLPARAERSASVPRSRWRETHRPAARARAPAARTHARSRNRFRLR